MMTTESICRGSVAVLAVLVCCCSSCPTGLTHSPSGDCVDPKHRTQLYATCLRGALSDRKETKSLSLSIDALLKGVTALAEARQRMEEKIDTKDLEAKRVESRCADLAGRDSKPRVVIIGGKNDYVEYHLSANMLSKALGDVFETEPLTVSYGWSDEQRVLKEPQPAIVIMHASAFSEKGVEDDAVKKFQKKLSYWYKEMKETRFVVFSSYPPTPIDTGKCKRWTKQVEFLTNQTEFELNRLAFLPVPYAERDLSSSPAGEQIQRLVRCFAGLASKNGCAEVMKQVGEAQTEAQGTMLRSCDATAL